jgi:hypothetical protein
LNPSQETPAFKSDYHSSSRPLDLPAFGCYAKKS